MSDGPGSDAIRPLPIVTLVVVMESDAQMYDTLPEVVEGLPFVKRVEGVYPGNLISEDAQPEGLVVDVVYRTDVYCRVRLDPEHLDDPGEILRVRYSGEPEPAGVYEDPEGNPIEDPDVQAAAQKTASEQTWGSWEMDL